MKSFNRRLGLGIRRDHSRVERKSEDEIAPFEPETVPTGVHKVAPLDQPLLLVNEKESIPTGRSSPPFRKRNIVAPIGLLV